MQVDWIKAADTLPGDGVDVLVTTEYAGKRYVAAAHRHGPFWLGSESHEVLLGDVVAWADLPEPSTL